MRGSVVLPVLLLLAASAELAAQVSIEPSRAQIQVDATRTLRFQADALAAGTRVRWISMNPSVASVDANGVVTAHRPGVVRIIAAAGQVSAEATITVPALPAADVDIRLETGEILAGTGLPVEIEIRDRLGDLLPDAEVVFESDRPDVARVDRTGRLEAIAPGRATVRVRAGEAGATAAVTVVPNPATSYTLTASRPTARTGDVVRFRVRGLDARGGGVGPLFPAWSVDGPGARIDADGPEGAFVAWEPGRHTITAYVGPQVVQRAVIEIEPRNRDGELVRIGHGLTVGHHAGDTWAFEGVDGRDYAIIGTFMHDWAKVFDITDPARPVLTDSVQLDARRINDVKIHPNNRIGILTREGASTRRNGIVVLDLTTPAHPAIIAEYTESLTGGVHNVWIDGATDLVYAVHNGTRDIRIIDISDPRNPAEVGRWGLDNPDRSLHDVIVQDGYAYLSYWDDGLIMLDVGAGTHGGSPREPAFVSRFQYPAGHTHTAWRHGRYLFIGDEIFPSDWDAARPIAATGYIHVVDYSDPDNPVEVAKYEVPESGAHNFWVEDDLLYVGYYQAGLRVLDVSGELRGDLYRQGRELGVFRTSSPDAITPNWSMTWGAQIFKGNIITSDLNSGLWIVKFRRTRTVF